MEILSLFNESFYAKMDFIFKNCNKLKRVIGFSKLYFTLFFKQKKSSITFLIEIED